MSEEKPKKSRKGIGGRPKWIPSEENLKQVEAMASRLMTNENIARCLGVSLRTIYKKKKEYKQFLHAIETGRAKGLKVVSNVLYEKATIERDFQSINKYLNRADPEWNGVQKIEVAEAPKTFADLYKEDIGESQEEDKDPNMKCS